MKPINVTVELKAEELKKKLNIKDGYTPKKGVDYFDGIDAEPVNTEEIVESVKEKIKKDLPTSKVIEDIVENTLPKKGRKVKEALEVLPEGEKLKIEAVENLREELDSVKKNGGQHRVVGANRSLYQLLDVNVAGITTGQSIQWDGRQWVAYTPSAGVTNFLDLTDTPNTYAAQATKGVRVNAGETALEFYTVVDTDEKVKYNASDIAAGYLADKVVAGTGISLAEGTGGDADKLVITNTGAVSDGDKGDITVSSSGAVWTVDNGLAATKIADGSVTNSEFQYLGGVTSDIQTQLNTKLSDVDNLNPIEVGFTNTASGCYSSAIGYCNATTTLNSVVGGRSNFTGTGIAAISYGILNNQTGGTITASTGVIAGTPAAANAGCTSVAMGICNLSSAILTNSFGFKNTASACCALAMGVTNTASGAASSAVGASNTVSGLSGQAFGSGNTVSSTDAAGCVLAYGIGNVVASRYSSAFGHGNAVNYSFNSSGSLALGRFNTICQSETLGVGYLNTACAFGSQAVGTVNRSCGVYSTAVGVNNTSSSTYSNALGYTNIASAACTAAIGALNTASVIQGTAIGVCNCASANTAIAMGFLNCSSGVSAIGVGVRNAMTTCNAQGFGRFNYSGTGLGAIALGLLNNQTTATYAPTTAVITGTSAGVNAGCSSLAVGTFNSATGYLSRAIGYSNVSSGCCSTAFGNANTASACNSHAFGANLTNATADSVEVGHSDTEKFRYAGGTFSFLTGQATATLDAGGTATSFTFADDVVMADAKNISFNATTGTKIGTATTEKLAFWNKTPIIQPAAANQAALTNSTGGAYDGTLADVGAVPLQATINDNFTDVYTLLTEIRTALVNAGIMKGSA